MASCRSTSGDDVLHNCARHVGQPEIPPAVTVGEPRVIEAHQLQHSCVEVMNMDGLVHCLEPKFVGGAVDRTAPHSTSREQIAESVIVVITAILHLHLSAHLD